MRYSLIPRTPRARRIVFFSGAALLVIFTVAIVLFARQVRDLRAHRATGPSWTFPSRVYSGDLSLNPGRLLPVRYLLAQLAVREYAATRAPENRPGTFTAQPDGFRIVLRGFLDARDPRGHGGPEVVRVHLDDSTLVTVERLGGLPGAPAPDLTQPPRLEPMRIAELFGEDRVRRSEVSLARIPPVVQDAVVASEDRRFYGHLGLDARANVRALVRNVRSGGVREGASTITQQLARGLFLGRERTLWRKVSEAALASGLEVLLSKRTILEMYLNSVYWGQANSWGVGGIAEASRWYFDTPVESLRADQAALLAGLIRSPATLSPFDHPAEALAKRNQVLDLMVETGRLGAAEAARWKAMPLGAKRGEAPAQLYPSYTGYVRETLTRSLAKDADEWGLSIFTALDPAWQAEAEQGMRLGLASLDGGRKRGTRLQGAFVALEAVSGRVLALVGGRDPDPGDFNRATQAKRQTGSAIKPIVYATAYSTGASGFTPASTVPDLRRTFGERRWAWRPRNDGDAYHPTVTLANALARSLNVATANVVEAISPGEVVRVAEQFGLGKLKPVMSIGLGTNEVTPLALTSAYAVFASGGIRHDPTPLVFVLDGEGHTVLAPQPEAMDVLPPTMAALMTGLLEDVVRYGVGYPLRAMYGFQRPVAGKTGTTNDYHDAWFVGFTPHVVAGVWVGYDRPRSLGRPAAHIAIPVWARIVSAMLEGFPPTPFPFNGGIEYAEIDPWNGYLAGDSTARMRVPFLLGTAPTQWLQDTLGWDTYDAELNALYLADTVATAPATGEEPATENPPPDTVTVVEPDTTWDGR